jgi:hypothetical protein
MKDAIDVRGRTSLGQRQQLRLAGALQLRLQLVGLVEVVLDGALVRPVMKIRCSAPPASASSAAYWISGLSTTGSISFGLALVAGRKRVPRPATGNTALRIFAIVSFP